MGKILTESLYEIAPQLRVLMESEEFDSEAFDSLVMAFEKKAEGITYFMGELTAFADMAKDEAKRITERARAAQARADRLKLYLRGCMEEAEIYEMEFGTKKLKIQNNPPKVIIDDQDKIPACYKTVETVVKVDKNYLKKALANSKIDGCHLEQGSSLRIR